MHDVRVSAYEAADMPIVLVHLFFAQLWTCGQVEYRGRARYAMLLVRLAMRSRSFTAGIDVLLRIIGLHKHCLQASASRFETDSICSTLHIRLPSPRTLTVEANFPLVTQICLSFVCIPARRCSHIHHVQTSSARSTALFSEFIGTC